MKIYFVDNIIDKNNVIVVDSKDKNCDIKIENHLDIILISSKIKTLLNYNNNLKKKAIFNLEKLDSKFIEAFIYRILQGNYYFDKYKRNDIERTILYFYVPQMKMENRKNIINIINGSYITRNIICNII